MTPEQQREEMSAAYVAAVAARAGCKLANWSQDDGCLDVTVGAAKSSFGSGLAAPKLDLQLKASSKHRSAKAGTIPWSLKRVHHETLRKRAQIPHILVALVLPDLEQDWLEHSNQELRLRRCAYWIHLLNQPQIPADRDSTTIYIPESQMFTPETLLSLPERSGRGEGIDAPLEGS